MRETVASESSTGIRWVDHFSGWIESRRAQVVVAAIVFQFVVLGWMIAANMGPLMGGNTLLVRVVPVDPRDLFRGEYVILGYDFSRLPAGVDAVIKPGVTVYVTLVLEQDGQHWRSSGFQGERPKEGIFLRGTVGKYGRVDYGIESFFVQEGKGKAYEDAVRYRKLSAEIAVDDHGGAKLKRLVIE